MQLKVKTSAPTAAKVDVLIELLYAQQAPRIDLDTHVGGTAGRSVALGDFAVGTEDDRLRAEVSEFPVGRDRVTLDVLVTLDVVDEFVLGVTFGGRRNRAGAADAAGLGLAGHPETHQKSNCQTCGEHEADAAPSSPIQSRRAVH